MDEMKIVSVFTTKLISKLIKKVLKKSFGCDIEIKINELNASVDSDVKFYISMNGSISKEQLENLIDKI